MSLVDRDFALDLLWGHGSRVALIAVDNALALQAVEDVGFGRLIEAEPALGLKIVCESICTRSPHPGSPREVWRQAGAVTPTPCCRPTVRCTSGPVTVAEPQGSPAAQSGRRSSARSPRRSSLANLTLCMGGKPYELISCHRRDLRDCIAVGGTALPAFVPGSVAAAA